MIEEKRRRYRHTDQITSDEVVAMQNMRAARWTVKQIAAELGCSERTVYYKLKGASCLKSLESTPAHEAE